MPTEISPEMLRLGEAIVDVVMPPAATKQDLHEYAADHWHPIRSLCKVHPPRCPCARRPPC